MGELGKAARGSTLRSGKGGSNKNLGKEGRAAAFKAGHALPPASPGAPHGFPITSPKSWEDARRAVGRVKSPARRAALAGLLRRTAAQYGKSKALKASWAAANTLPALEFAMVNRPRLPVSSPFDLVISRGAEGEAIVRHRRGGYEIGRITRGTDGAWVAAAGGKDLNPHTRQRGALLELIGTHNRSTPSPYHRGGDVVRAPALQRGDTQTELMRAAGVPAISTLATPTAGSSDGPRTTGNDISGLGRKGQTIYKKLRGRGFPHERAHNFARRAERK